MNLRIILVLIMLGGIFYIVVYESSYDNGVEDAINLIDSNKPMISFGGYEDGYEFTSGNIPKISFNVLDAVSGDEEK